MLRIGVSPWEIAINNCILTNSNTKACRKRPGIEIETLFAFLNYLNISWTIVRSNEIGCGSSNGRYLNDSNGLFGMLARGEIDVTGNICRMGDKRVGAFSFTPPVYYNQQIFVMKKRNSMKRYVRSDAGMYFWILVVVAGLTVTIVTMVPNLLTPTNLLFNFLKVIELYSTRTMLLRIPKRFVHRAILMNLWFLSVRILFCFFGNAYKMQVLIQEYDIAPFTNVHQLSILAAAETVKFIEHARHNFRMPHTANEETRELFEQSKKFGYVKLNASKTLTVYKVLAKQKPWEIPLVYRTYDTWYQQEVTDVEHGLLFIRDHQYDSARFAYMYRRGLKWPKMFRSLGQLLPSLVSAVRHRYLHQIHTATFKTYFPDKYRAGRTRDYFPIFTFFLVVLLLCLVLLIFEIVFFIVFRLTDQFVYQRRRERYIPIEYVLN